MSAWPPPHPSPYPAPGQSGPARGPYPGAPPGSTGYPPTGPTGYPLPGSHSYPPLGPPSGPPTGFPGVFGYPPQPPGYPPSVVPGPYGYPQAPQPPKSHVRRWLAVAVAVLVLLAGGSTLWWFGRGHSSTTATKPDITVLSEALLLDRDRFAGFAGDNWESIVDAPGSPAGNPDGGTDQTFDPEECRRLGAPDETQTGGSSLSGSADSGHVDTVSLLSLTAQRFDPTRYLDRCARYTSTSAGADGTFTMVTITKRVSPPRIPDWAIAYTTTIEDDPPTDGPNALYSRVLTIQGYYRGILVSAIHHEMLHGKRPDGTDDDRLVALFNAQVAKVAAAP